MITIFFVMFASSLTAIGNYFSRRSVDLANQGGDPFIVYRQIAGGIIGFVIGYFIHGTLGWDPYMFALGIIAGCILGLVGWLSGRALRYGPPGLNFAILNSACIAPPLLLALLFGEEFGHTYTSLNAFGALLVVGGILWASISTQSGSIRKEWYPWAAASFIVHAFLLTFFQWRALTLKEGIPGSFFIPFHCDPCKADIFVPAMSLAACLIQFFLPFGFQRVDASYKEVAVWGWLGGLISGAAGFCTMMATEAASRPWEKAIVFPLFCVSVIIFCNLWGKAFYKESVHWTAMVVSLLGLLLCSA
jgi:hypothetical protein